MIYANDGASAPGSNQVEIGLLDTLRDELGNWQPAAGPDGFEGLIAQALASLSGYTFRLARSGAQFGRDAATPLAPFAIAMEAKRYNSSVPLEALAGKASLAAFALADRIDLWALAATVEVSEPSQQMLTELLDEKGITLLMLDWNMTGLPSLAVLIAAARQDILPWVETRKSRALRERLEPLLAAIAADERFDAERRKLLGHLAPATVGLEAWRLQNRNWLAERFGDRAAAQRDFSQFLTPMAGAAVPRPAIDARIAAAIETARAKTDGHAIAAVLGGEGSGKSWAVAQWWLAQDSRPVLLLSIGQMAGLLSDLDEPLDMLARLAAFQMGRRDAAAIARWRRRIENWSEPANSRDRFVIFIDGLNETSGKPWASILRSLAPAVRDLGGVIVATCREGYWRRDIAPRLGLLEVAEALVEDYSDAEFAEILRLHGVQAQSLSERLDRFMRNPRICTLAISMIDRLETIEDLSVERLLMEYWRARLVERGDLVGHDDLDFRDLLMAHAREYRARPGTDFNRNEWRSRSGAALRDDGRNLGHDLSDIEEGRFFDPGTGTYRFQPEAREFALGLLVADEISAAARNAPADSPETLERIIDAVRAFDMVSNILMAALAIAVLDADYPDAGIEALIEGWFSLQNLAADLPDAPLPYVAARAKPFFDAYEHRDLRRDDGRLLVLLLTAAQTRSAVAAEFDLRIPGWLGSWNRHHPAFGTSDERDRQRQRERNERIDAQIASLAPPDRTLFDTHCTEAPNANGLAGAATMRLTGLAQAGYARAITAFALADSIAGSNRSAMAELEWAVRLNRIDHKALAAEVRDVIALWMNDEAAPAVRNAAETALWILGSLAEQQAAEAMRPPRPPREARRYSHYFAEDPTDPDARQPDDLAALRDRLQALEPLSIWTQMSVIAEDYELSDLLSGLARFDGAALAGHLNRIVASVSARTGMPLRQLSWHLPSLGPLLGDEARAAVLQAIRETTRDRCRVPGEDADFVIAMMAEALLPHLEAEMQLDLLQSLPLDTPYLTRFDFLAKPMPSAMATARLAAVRGADNRIRDRTLFFLSSRPTDAPDAALCDEVEAALLGEGGEVRGAAAEYIRRNNIPRLDDAILALPPPDHGERSWRAAAHRQAFATAVMRRGRADLLDRVPIEFLDLVAVELPEARERLADTIDALITRFSEPIAAPAPIDALIRLDVDEDTNDAWLTLRDASEGKPTTIEDVFDGDHDTRFETRQALIQQQYDQFIADLEREDAVAIVRRPHMVGLDRLAADHPERYASLLRRILAIADEDQLRQLQNLGYALASGYAATDAELAAEVFAYLWKVEPHVQIRVGPARVWLRDIALFGAPDCERIDALRRRAFLEAISDDRIERLVVAAERAGRSDWLDAFMADQAASVLPSELALAITIAGLSTASPVSTEILGRDWLSGFLGDAARVARQRSAKADHARYWLDLACNETDNHERWRHLELAIAAADRRLVLRIDHALRDSLRDFGGDVLARIEKQADKVSQEAEKTLYGTKKPQGLMAALLSS